MSSKSIATFAAVEDNGAGHGDGASEIRGSPLATGRNQVEQSAATQSQEDEAEADEGTSLLAESGAHISHGRFASKDMLKQYIPELDPEHPRAVTLRVKMAKRSTMLNLQLSIALLVVVINIVLIIALIHNYPLDFRGVGTFSYGNCSTLSTINSAIHVALNIVSSLFLGAGNYCMQILVAPSRAEIDKAHAEGRYLEIGVPSIKNLRYIQRRRVLIWILIGFFSTLLHFFWNSAIFTSLPVAAIPRAVVTNDFLRVDDPWNVTDPLGHREWWKFAPGYGEASHNKSLIYSLQQQAPTMSYLGARECAEHYVNPLTASSGVIVVARNMTYQQYNRSSLLDGWVSAWEPWSDSTGWICSAYQDADILKWRFCTKAWVEQFPEPWVLLWPGQWEVEVDYCLAGEDGDNEQRCGLHYSAHILGIVCACTFAEACLVFTVWFRHRYNRGAESDVGEQRTMVTIGDAIHSYLKRPCRSKEDTGHDEAISAKLRPGYVIVCKGSWNIEARVSWLRAVSNSIWIISYAFFAIGIAIPSAAVASSLMHLSRVGVDISPSAIWQQGFKPHPAAVSRDLRSFGAAGTGTTSTLLGHVLVSNSPQMLMSFLYLFYNNILTRQVVADEWLRFLRKDGKKPLRVSSPVGMQRSSYFLSLPFKYSIPLLGLSTVLHWLISQSLFLVQSSAFGPGAQGERLPVYDMSARGYSPLGCLMALALAFLMILLLPLNGVLRNYENIPLGFQRIGHNSSAIKALCQQPEEDRDAHLFPISIGIVENDQDMVLRCEGRLTFSTDIKLNQSIQPGKLYLLPIIVTRSAGRWRRVKIAFDVVFRPRRFVTSSLIQLSQLRREKGNLDSI
ncbi:hypothetical protein JX266_010927 [Neoarthrinium moseri]|nr:hypothetical protein JX266_010927 [Neoarthrinium moseri]